ncbi:MAG: hypothetical protein HYT29_01340 [Parcubacteria group bacterium]|nr:hypothetical protein [Parcubacteria group bacterium]
MHDILIGTKNPHKQQKLSDIVSPLFHPVIRLEIPDIKESGASFQKTAEQKALACARWFGGRAVSTDGGAIIPALSSAEWEPLYTRRFAGTDQGRITRLLQMMRGKKDRRVKWFEAIAVADTKRILFSTTVEAMEGVLDETSNPNHYKEGIWLCSITSFPQFGGRNFFELSREERALTEDSWEKLKKEFLEFFAKNTKN